MCIDGSKSLKNYIPRYGSYPAMGCACESGDGGGFAALLHHQTGHLCEAWGSSKDSHFWWGKPWMNHGYMI